MAAAKTGPASRGHFTLVDGRDLVGQRLDDGGVDGEDRVEEVGEVDALGLGHEAEEGAVPVETPRASFLDDLELGLAVTVKKLIADLASRILIGRLEGVRAEPLDADDCDDTGGQNAAHGSAGLPVFKPNQQQPEALVS